MPGLPKTPAAWTICRIGASKICESTRGTSASRYITPTIGMRGQYDDLWNAAQKEMLLRGNPRLLSDVLGKEDHRVVPHYREAADTMIDLHGRYALDGRDPNTYTNILWCFGLHDRPWPERAVFGKCAICLSKACNARRIRVPISKT